MTHSHSSCQHHFQYCPPCNAVTCILCKEEWTKKPMNTKKYPKEELVTSEEDNPEDNNE